MRVFLAAGRETSDPPPFTAAAEWLGKLGDVYIQNAGGNREALGRDLHYVCHHAEAVAFLLGWEQSAYSNAIYRAGICFDLPMIMMPEAERLGMWPAKD